MRARAAWKARLSSFYSSSDGTLDRLSFARRLWQPCAPAFPRFVRAWPRHGAASSPCAGDEMRKRRAVFHQSDIVDVGHFRAADALIDPAHHIAQNALRVVVQFLAQSSARPVAAGRQRDGSAVASSGARRSAATLGLPRGDIDAMIVRGVQRRGRGRGYPGGVGAGAAGGRSFCVEHVGHAVGRRPTCPCRSAPCPDRPQGKPDLHVAVLIGLEPVGCSSCRPCGSWRRLAWRCGSRRRCGRGSRC